MANLIAQVVYDACYGLVAIVPETLEPDDPVIMADAAQASSSHNLIVSAPDIRDIAVVEDSNVHGDQQDSIDFVVFHYFCSYCSDYTAYRHVKEGDYSQDMVVKAKAHYDSNPPDDDDRNMYEQLCEEDDRDIDLM
jgi:hypothetical protein